MPGKKRKSLSKAPVGRKKPSRKSPESSQHTQRLKYRQWNDDSMVGALKAVSEGMMGVNRAALEYGIPKSTLKDRVAGRVSHGCKSGRTPYLTHSEEEELYHYLLTCANIGYPKRRDDVIGIVRKTVESKPDCDVSGFKGKGWWLRYMQRWPKLALRKGDALAQPRANAANSENLKHYYDLLEETLKKHELF